MDNAANPAAPAIFLHCAFRSGSTWLWSRFREASGVCAYYEPFHEVLATLTTAMIGELWPDPVGSGHPDLSVPYFHEYRMFVRPDGGATFFQPRFAYDRYYDQDDDDAQARYVRMLTREARDMGRIPVLGFCRSLGRVPWFAGLGEGINVVAFRNPWDQWVSCRRLAVEYNNPYFLVRTVQIAGIGSRHPLHAEAFADLPLPDEGDEVGFVTKADMDTLFRIFLRVYLVDLMVALPHADLTVDIDALAKTEAQQALASALETAAGLRGLSFAGCRSPRNGPLDDADYPAHLDEGAAIIDRLEKRAGYGAAEVLRERLKTPPATA